MLHTGFLTDSCDMRVAAQGELLGAADMQPARACESCSYLLTHANSKGLRMNTQRL